MPPPPIKTSLFIKTPTYSSIRGHRGTHSTAAFLTFLPIASILGTAITITTFTSTEFVGGYLAITVFIYIDIIYKWVTNIVKDI